jgi:8-oxo-dGTP pyrophosphatase MutT (NUDIX family)
MTTCSSSTRPSRAPRGSCPAASSSRANPLSPPCAARGAKNSASPSIITEHDLFAVEWLQATRPGRRDRFAFLFAGPVLTTADTDRITLQRAELDAWRWAPRAEAQELLHPAIAVRIVGPLQTPGSTVYRETRHEGTL